MEIKPYFNNAKKHPVKQLEQIANSIREFGWQQPIVVDKNGVIIVGHGRWEAYKKYDLPEPPIQVANFTKEQANAYRLADNKLNESEWDMNLVIEELKGLSDEMLELTGFDRDLIIEPDEKDDEVPDVPVEPQSKLGDLYELGNHRVLCGDSTDSEAVARLMDGKKANLSFSSPPYNAGALEIDGNESTQKKYQSYDDNKTEDEYFQFLFDFLSTAMMFSDEQFVNIGLVEKNKRVIIRLNHAFVDKFKDIIYWKKSTVAPHIQKGVINNLVEFILCFGDGKRNFLNPQFGQGTYWNVIEGKNASGNEVASVHKATFPVYLPENILTNFTSRNGIVLESFLGSGSTLIASEKTGRICYGMELDPKYVDVIVQRYVDYTGNATIKKNGKELIWQKSK